MTTKTLENWTKDLRDEPEQATVADAAIADERVEELAQELIRDELFVFGCLSQKKKRNRARICRRSMGSMRRRRWPQMYLADVFSLNPVAQRSVG